MNSISTAFYSVSDLVKEFSPGTRLDYGTFTCHLGETIAIVGANGSGKSTLFELLTGNMDATSGEIRVLGQSLVPSAFELKRSFGYLPQNLSLPPWVSGLEVLRYSAALHGIPDQERCINMALAFWDCREFAHKPLKACSYGTRKRIALALATLHEPECLIVDEPFSGLDILHIRALQAKIADRNTKGKLTILSTHITPYVAQLCNRAFILQRVEDGATASIQLQTLTGWNQKSFVERVQQIEGYFA